MAVQIRTATAADLDAIVALNAVVQRRHAEALPDLFKTAGQSLEVSEVFRGFLSDPTNRFLLAEAGQPVGYLWAQFQSRAESWARLPSQLLYVHHVVVASEHQKRGVGRLLVNEAIDLARQEGVRRIELDVWSFNTGAVDFYQKHGFKTFNERMALTL